MPISLNCIHFRKKTGFKYSEIMGKYCIILIFSVFLIFHKSNACYGNLEKNTMNTHMYVYMYVCMYVFLYIGVPLKLIKGIIGNGLIENQIMLINFIFKKQLCLNK